MSVTDFVNGIFELGGGILLVQNCRLLYRDKEVKGVSVPVTAFFAAWGLWNLFYYPHLEQWASFAGGLVIVSANLVWVGMAVYYARRKEPELPPFYPAGIDRTPKEWWPSSLSDNQ